MQIDLQEGMYIDNFYYYSPADTISERLDFARAHDGHWPPIPREGNVYWITRPASEWTIGETYSITLNFRGSPRVARHPPWDGGLIWTKDSAGKPWVAVACQGLGASAWWPCKDYQGDEPDSGISVRSGFAAASVISNGTREQGIDSVLQENVFDSNTKLVVKPFEYYSVSNPINLYNLTFYLGDYATYTDTFRGEGGVLPLTFHPLRYNEAKARKHWAVVKDMLRCFEYWMGPYPFYEDGYKLVEAPYLGMEHQSAVAYGNGYQMGYLGTDRSGTGVGMLFDYIIIHESGHEWFGNNITATDVADNWIHEGFTTYTETLYAEWIAGKEKAARYNRGEWRNIANDRPIIGAYGVADDGSGDKYDKGAAILHMIRTIVANDSVFRQILRGLNKEFRHQTVTTKQVEDFIDGYTALDLRPFFNQYLRTTQIPTLEWSRQAGNLRYRFTNAVPGFSLPVAVEESGRTLTVTTEWQSAPSTRRVAWENNFLMDVRKVRP